jgi:hypothetical protein
MARRIEEVREDISMRLEKAREAMKKQYNKHCKDMTF